MHKKIPARMGLNGDFRIVPLSSHESFRHSIAILLLTGLPPIIVKMVGAFLQILPQEALQLCTLLGRLFFFNAPVKNCCSRKLGGTYRALTGTYYSQGSVCSQLYLHGVKTRALPCLEAIENSDVSFTSLRQGRSP